VQRNPQRTAWNHEQAPASTFCHEGRGGRRLLGEHSTQHAAARCCACRRISHRTLRAYFVLTAPLSVLCRTTRMSGDMQTHDRTEHGTLHLTTFMVMLGSAALRAPCTAAPRSTLNMTMCSVFAKVTIRPNSGKCDPHLVHNASTLWLHGGQILALAVTLTMWLLVI
jgi:hypothetical protein